MTQQNLIKRFHELGMTNQEIATYLKYSVDTVKAWKRDEYTQDGRENSNFQRMIPPVYEYVTMKLGELT